MFKNLLLVPARAAITSSRLMVSARFHSIVGGVIITIDTCVKTPLEMLLSCNNSIFPVIHS